MDNRQSAGGTVAKIILSFDDARQDQYIAARKFLTPLRMPAVFNITSGFIDGEKINADIKALPMTWKQVRWLSAQDQFEVAVHGHSHTNVMEDLLRCRDRIYEELGLTKESMIGMASPGSGLSMEMIDRDWRLYQEKGFSYIRTGALYRNFRSGDAFASRMETKSRIFCRKCANATGSPGLYGLAYSRNIQSPAEIFPRRNSFGQYCAVPVMGYVSAEQVCGLVDRTIRKKGVCTLMFHSIAMEEDSREDVWSWNCDRFRRLVHYLNRKAAARCLEVITPAMLAKRMITACIREN